MKYRVLLLAFAAPFALVTPSFAQAGASGVPDLSEFAGAISKAVETTPKVKAPASGVFKTTLAVPSVKPGATARGIGKQLRETIEKQTGPNPALAQLETGMPQMLTQMEAGLVKIGFAKRDLGIAYAYAFIDLYETATKQTVPEEGSKAAARVLATAIAKHWGPKYARLTPAAKEKMYESLLISTTLNTAFAEQFEKAGKTADAASIRQTSAQLFETLVGVPPSQVTISPEGRITGLASGTP